MEYDLYHYQRQQEIIESWQKHDYTLQLHERLRSVLIALNWHKNIFVSKCNELSNDSFKSLKNSFKKYLNEVKDIDTKLKLIGIHSKRVQTIKNKIDILITKTYDYEQTKNS